MLEHEVAANVARGIVHPTTHEMYEDQVVTLRQMCKTLPAKKSKGKVDRKAKTEFAFLFKGKTSSQQSEDTEVPQSPVASKKAMQRDTSENRHTVLNIYSKYFSQSECLDGSEKKKTMEELKGRGKEAASKIVSVSESLSEESKSQIKKALESVRMHAEEFKATHFPSHKPKPNPLNKSKRKKFKPKKRKRNEVDNSLLESESNKTNEEKRVGEGTERKIYRVSLKTVNKVIK